MAKKKDGYIKVKAEYELIYAEKLPRASILTNTLEAPLQEVRVFNEDNGWEDGWRNMLIFGDNLLALKTLYEEVRAATLLTSSNQLRTISTKFGNQH